MFGGFFHAKLKELPRDYGSSRSEESGKQSISALEYMNDDYKGESFER